jgi:hypothetical protein
MPITTALPPVSRMMVASAPRTVGKSSTKIAVASTTAMLLTMTPQSRPLASDYLYKQPCTIEVLDGHRPSVHTDCVVRSSMTQGAYDATITIPDGRKFHVNNAGPSSYAAVPPPGPDPSDIWFLNGKHARKTGAAARPCYQNARVKICLE